MKNSLKNKKKDEHEVGNKDGHNIEVREGRGDSADDDDKCK